PERQVVAGCVVCGIVRVQDRPPVVGAVALSGDEDDGRRAVAGVRALAGGVDLASVADVDEPADLLTGGRCGGGVRPGGAVGVCDFHRLTGGCRVLFRGGVARCARPGGGEGARRPAGGEVPVGVRTGWTRVTLGAPGGVRDRVPWSPSGRGGGLVGGSGRGGRRVGGAGGGCAPRTGGARASPTSRWRSGFRGGHAAGTGR